MKRRQKEGFLSPKSSKITVTKEKESRKTKSEEKERRRREKSNGCTLVVFSGWLLWREISGRKKLLDAKGPFGDNVLKNPARCMYVCVCLCVCVCVVVCILQLQKKTRLSTRRKMPPIKCNLPSHCNYSDDN